jgi:hypothetical protein
MFKPGDRVRIKKSHKIENPNIFHHGVIYIIDYVDTKNYSNLHFKFKGIESYWNSEEYELVTPILNADKEDLGWGI